jgi:hypothetical protein
MRPSAIRILSCPSTDMPNRLSDPLTQHEARTLRNIIPPILTSCNKSDANGIVPFAVIKLPVNCKVCKVDANLLCVFGRERHRGCAGIRQHSKLHAVDADNRMKVSVCIDWNWCLLRKIWRERYSWLRCRRSRCGLWPLRLLRLRLLTRLGLSLLRINRLAGSGIVYERDRIAVFVDSVSIDAGWRRGAG